MTAVTPGPASPSGRLLLSRTPGDAVYGTLFIEHAGEKLAVRLERPDPNGDIVVAVEGARSFVITRAELLVARQIAEATGQPFGVGSSAGGGEGSGDGL